MNRILRRLLPAVAVTIVVVGAWVARAGPSTAPVGPAANALPSPTAMATADAGSGPTPTAGWSAVAVVRPSPSAPVPTPVASGTPGGSGPPPTFGRHQRIIPSATPLLRAALDARLEQLRQQYAIPGMSATITFADGSVWNGATGLADVAAGRDVTADTAFSVASVSKTFTAALILGLVEDGLLALDSNVRPYLPDLAIDPAITVRQLLDHTSGLRDFYVHPRIDTALLARPGRVWDAARSLTYVGKPYAKPGISWRYSNTNYLILGLLAEAVVDAPVAEQLRDRFLTPLGLEHTWYQGSEAARGQVARGYRFTGPGKKLAPIELPGGSRIVPFASVVTASGAAGSIASTAADLARWARLLYDGIAIGSTSRDEMVADILRTARYEPSVGYGLGVQAVAIGGRPTLGHSGRFLGARAAMRWLPGERIAVAVLTNQSRADPGVVLADLLALVFEPQPDCITCPAIP